jgi:hypothetical protein
MDYRELADRFGLSITSGMRDVAPEDLQVEQLRRDRMLFGVSYVMRDGTRVDPQDVHPAD